MGNINFAITINIALMKNQKHKAGEEYLLSTSIKSHLPEAVPVAGNFEKLLLCWFFG